MRIILTIITVLIVLTGYCFDIPGQSFHANDDQTAQPTRINIGTNTITNPDIPSLSTASASVSASDTIGVADDEENIYFLLMGQADMAIADGNYWEAIQIMKDALEVEPNNPTNVMVLSNMGMVYYYLEQDSLAMNALNKALDIAPNMVTILSNRARVNMSAGRDRAAFADYEKVLSLDSININARFYHGIMSLFGGDALTARQDFDVLESIVPESSDNLVAQATYYSLTGDDQKAIPYFKKLIKRDPSPEYYAALAGCYLGQGDLYGAAETITEGLEKYPQDGELFYYRAWLRKEQHRNQEALDDAKIALSLGVNPMRIEQLQIPK